MNPQRFFDVALPQLAAQHAAVFRTMKGRVVFAIADHGAWTVNLGDEGQPVTEGAGADPALSLFFTDEAFGRLLDSTLDFDHAIERKAVGYQGDLTLLEKLGFLLSAGSNSDAVQVDQVSIGMKRV